MKKLFKLIVGFIVLAFAILQLSCNQQTDKKSNYFEYDNIDYIGEIQEKGYFEDLNGKIFNEYMKSEHFEIYYDKDNSSDKIYAKSVLNELENNYDRVLNFFNLKDGSLPVVKINLYPDYDQFRMSIFKEISFDIDNMRGISGYTLGPSKFYLTYQNNKYVTRTAVHEFVHCVTFNFTYVELMPIWLFEGLAMYLSQDKDIYIDYYPGFAEKGLPLSYELDDYSNRYIYGYSLVEYIDVKFGRDKLLDLLKNGDIEETLGITEEDFSEGWKDFISSKIVL